MYSGKEKLLILPSSTPTSTSTRVEYIIHFVFFRPTHRLNLSLAQLSTSLFESNIIRSCWIFFTWVRLLYSALKQGVIGTISFVTFYALQLDSYLLYLSQISLLYQGRRPHKLSKKFYLFEASGRGDREQWQLGCTALLLVCVQLQFLLTL